MYLVGEEHVAALQTSRQPIDLGQSKFGDADGFGWAALNLSAASLQGCSFILDYPLHVWTSCSKVVGALPKVSHIDVRVWSP